MRRHWPAAIWASVLPLVAGCPEPTHLEAGWTSLGLPASAEVYTTTKRGAAILMEQFPAAMEKVAEDMSLDRPGSELSRINREAALGFYKVENRDLYRCIGLALDYAKASEGAYDPTIGPVSALYRLEEAPDESEIAEALGRVDWSDVVMEREVFSLRFTSSGTRLDLSGMVEGYALDVAARKFVRAGSRAGLLRLGDYAYAWGRPPDEPSWRVPLNDPREPGRPFVMVRLESRAVAVSGAGATVLPVLDPHTGKPASSDTLVVAAVADSVADAAAVSRAILVGGSRRAGALLGKTRRVEAVLLVENERERYVIASASLQGRLEPSDGLNAEATGGIRYLLPPAEV